MTIYIDNAFIPYRGMLMSHMMGTDLDELHVMAEKIGLKRSWFQDKRIPHYDVSKGVREIAIKNGAIPIDPFEVGIPKDVIRRLAG